MRHWEGSMVVLIKCTIQTKNLCGVGIYNSLHTAHLKMDGTAKLSGMLPILYHCLPIIDIHQLLVSVHVCMCVWW